MIDEQFVKVGQKFKSQVNGAILEIIKIGHNWLGETYVTVKDEKNRFGETGKEWFKRLLLDVIKEDKAND